MSSEMQSLAFPFNAAGERHAGLNMRQYAAIHLKVPNSGTSWLDDMILESLKNDFAAKAMQSLLNDGHLDQREIRVQGPIAVFSNLVARAMIVHIDSGHFEE